MIGRVVADIDHIRQGVLVAHIARSLNDPLKIGWRRRWSCPRSVGASGGCG